MVRHMALQDFTKFSTKFCEFHAKTQGANGVSNSDRGANRMAVTAKSSGAQRSGWSSQARRPHPMHALKRSAESLMP